MQGHVDSERLAMPIRRTSDGRWRYRHVVQAPDGTRERINGSAPTHLNTKVAAERAMLDHIERALTRNACRRRKETPTFSGVVQRTVLEGMGGRSQEQAERGALEGHHLRVPPQAAVRRDAARRDRRRPRSREFRATLVAKKLCEKRINNILAVLSKPLKYAVDCELIAKAPRIGMFKVERPEIVAWDFEQYARLLAAAKVEGDEWYAAVCLAGEAGLRVGEVKALRWREDVDMIAKTITVNQQTRNRETTTPKGRTRRTIPMTATLHEALKRMSVIREGLVVRNLDGTAKTDDQADKAIAPDLPARRAYRFACCTRCVTPSGPTPRCSA